MRRLSVLLALTAQPERRAAGPKSRAAGGEGGIDGPRLRGFAAALVLSGIALALVASPAAAQEVAAVAAVAKPAVVLLDELAPNGEVLGNGTGFIVSADGRVVTNVHVIAEAREMRATLADGTKRRVVGVLAEDEDRDVAIVQLEPGTYPTLPLAERAPDAEGTKVFVVGSPIGLAWTVTEGIVSHAHRTLPEQMRAAEKLGELVQITAPISPGSSGSPVLTFDGKVIGVAQSIIAGANNVGFAVPVDVVLKLQAGIAPGAKPQPLQPFPMTNAIISGVFLVCLAGVLLWVKLRDRKRAAPAPMFHRHPGGQRTPMDVDSEDKWKQ